jgi:hypothetical protein
MGAGAASQGGGLTRPLRQSIGGVPPLLPGMQAFLAKRSRTSGYSFICPEMRSFPSKFAAYTGLTLAARL